MPYETLAELISQRVSFPRLTEPAPDADTLNAAFKAAFRAPDHMMLRPWRFVIVEGDARSALGAEICRIATEEDPDLSELQRDKYKGMPMRAPLIIVAISQNVDHPKVPFIEQEISCGVAVGYMLLVLQEKGFGGIWRTGPLARHSQIKALFGLAPQESIVGFLYAGTPLGEAKPIADLDVSDFVTRWQAP